MKNLKNLKGAKVISKSEQQVIKGGTRQCNVIYNPCTLPWICEDGECVLSPF